MFLIFCCVFVAWFAQDTGAACPPIIGRREWDAVKPAYKKHLQVPVDLVIIQHTVTQACTDDVSCAGLVRSLQKIHTEQAHLWDIAPSFLVAQTGKLYEGRGWHTVAVHTTGFNNQSIAIAFIGTFNNQEPSPKALDAAKALIQCGVTEERLTPDHKVVVHNQLIPTESPGQKLASKIMSWPDWVKDVTEIKKLADKDELQSQPRTGNDLVLTSPKQIDLLSNMRDVIGALINNMSKLAHGTVDTVTTLAMGLNKQASLFFETLASGLKKMRDQVEAAFTAIAGIPGAQKCSNNLKQKANTIYDTTETKAKDCANQRVKEIQDMINILGTLSANAIDYTNTAVENTKNCTELNAGVAGLTKACLTSVTKQTESASKTYESQRTTSLNAINTQLQALPAALDLCAKEHLTIAGTETTKIVSEISKCPTNSIVPDVFSFGRG